MVFNITEKLLARTYLYDHRFIDGVEPLLTMDITIYIHIVLLLVHCLWFRSASMIERLIFLLLMTYPHIPRQPQSIWGPGTVVVSPGKKVGRGYVGYPNGHGNHGNRGNHGWLRNPHAMEARKINQVDFSTSMFGYRSSLII